MRLLDLQLIRFGHFADVTLDFESGARGFQLIFGHNEAGKTTALRAIAGFLFGIPERTPDDHRHKAAELRIGARLERASGERLHAVRRKGRKDTLLDAGGQPLEEAALQAFLGGVSRELFETMFGLSHEALVAGGEELLRGRGDVGESLFAAAAGLRGLHRLLESLDQQAGQIFKTGAQKPQLNQALAKLANAQKEVRSRALRPADWQELQRELEEKHQQLDALRQERAQCTSGLRQDEMLLQALPDLREREALLARQHQLGEVALLAEDAGEQRRAAQRRLADIAQQCATLRQEHADLSQQLSQLAVPERLLEAEARLRMLEEERGAYIRALDDRRGLASRIEAGRSEIASLLRELPEAVAFEDIETIRIDAARRTRIQRLARDGERLHTRAQALRESAEADQRSTLEAQRELGALPPQRDATPLRSVLAAARKAGDIESSLGRLASDIHDREANAQAELRALPLWSGALAELAMLATPLDETVDRFEREFAAIEEQRRSLAQRQAELREQRAAKAAQVRDLESRAAIPSRDDLERARSERDAVWREVRGAWLAGAPSRIAPEALAGEYEQHVGSADTLANRMFAEHERVARLAALQEERSRIERGATALDAEQETLAARENALQASWRGAWVETTLEPRSPREMRGWLARQRRLAEASRELDALRREEAALRQEAARHRESCLAALRALGESGADGQDGLAATLEAADRVCDAIEAAERERLRLEERLTHADQERQKHAQALAQVEAELAQWRVGWGEAVAALRLGENAHPEDADTVLHKLTQIFEKLGELHGVEERVRHIDEDALRFEHFLAELVQEAAPDLPEAAARERSQALLDGAQQGREARAKRESLAARIRGIETRLAALAREAEQASATLAALQARAGSASIEELENAEQRSAEARSITGRLSDIEARLARAGPPLGELVARAREADEGLLGAEIERHRDALEANERRRDASSAELGRLEQALAAMDGGRAAADAAAEAEEALAEVGSLVHDYARLRLAALVLGREIQRYGSEHQGPVLRRTGELFRRMTLGAFSGVTSDFGGQDEPVILCERASEGRVDVSGLSDGTRDQLYLALRLAALEHHMRHSEPMPLIVDDVLVSFDDRRSRATLELLGELAQHTQILFFTHHERLVELARAAIPEAQLGVQRLEGA